MSCITSKTIIASVNHMQWSHEGVGDDKNMDYEHKGWWVWELPHPVNFQTTDVGKDGCVDIITGLPASSAPLAPAEQHSSMLLCVVAWDAMEQAQAHNQQRRQPAHVTVQLCVVAWVTEVATVSMRQNVPAYVLD